MNKFLKLSAALVKDESGQDLIEYALVAAIIGLGTISSMNSLATAIGNSIVGVANTLTGAV